MGYFKLLSSSRKWQALHRWKIFPYNWTREGQTDTKERIENKKIPYNQLINLGRAPLSNPISSNLLSKCLPSCLEAYFTIYITTPKVTYPLFFFFLVNLHIHSLVRGLLAFFFHLFYCYLLPFLITVSTLLPFIINFFIANNLTTFYSSYNYYISDTNYSLSLSSWFFYC